MCTGGRKNQLNASMLATETASASGSPQSDRDRQHREDVEHAEAEHRHVGLEQLDRAGDDGDGRSAREERDGQAPRIAVEAHDVNATPLAGAETFGLRPCD